uniref:Uncharacterized protein n=1 Tax=Oryza punctata TaxID=4537 RepID=A0A0E0L397_ORYPU
MAPQKVVIVSSNVAFGSFPSAASESKLAFLPLPFASYVATTTSTSFMVAAGRELVGGYLTQGAGPGDYTGASEQHVEHDPLSWLEMFGTI